MKSIPVLLVSLVMLSSFVASARTSLPLCDASKGFAGELNSKFSLTPDVEIDSQKHEAIVIGVGPIIAMGPVSASLNATLELNGVVISLVSNREGLLVIEDRIPIGTVIEVDVNNRREDGPTPFTIFSYVANRPTCFVDVERGRSFRGPVPTSVGGVPAKIFFVSHPTSYDTFTLNVDGGISHVVTFADSAEKVTNNTVAVLGADSQKWAPRGPVYIVIQPSSSSGVWDMRVSIVWSKGGMVEPDTPEVTEQPYSPPSGGDMPNSKPPQKAHTSRLAIALLLMFLGGLCYFVGRAVYNYRVLEIHEFPECVPHHVAIAGMATRAKGLFASTRDSFNERKSAYAHVNGDDDDAV